MKCLWRALAVVVACGLLTTGVAKAVPGTVTYTGELLAANGIPYDGEAAVTVRLFGAMSGGSPLATEDMGDVTIERGVLEVSLDDLGAAAASTDNLWLEFEIDGETLSPRQKVTSVPFAHRAGDADTLGGMPASAFLPASGTIDNADLPTNGLAAVSNGAMSNEFENVTWNAGGLPSAIPDFPGPATIASITTSETGSTYITSLTIYTGFTLTANSNITLELIPPPGTGIGVITLINDSTELPSQTRNDVWTPGNVPELAALIGTEVEGQWVARIQDTTEDLLGTAPVGTFNSFQLVYDVVRSDEVKMQGDMIVEGNLQVGGMITGGSVNRSGEVFPHWGSHGCPGGSQVLYTGFTFVNHHTHSGSSDPICMEGGDPGGTTSGDAGVGLDLLYTASLANAQGTGMPSGSFGLKCAMCYVPENGPCFDRWGAWTCPANWNVVYDGYGYGSHYQHAAPMGRICVDKDDVDSSQGGNSAGWLYPMAMWSTGGTPGGFPTQRAVKCAKCCRNYP